MDNDGQEINILKIWFVCVRSLIYTCFPVGQIHLFYIVKSNEIEEKKTQRLIHQMIDETNGQTENKFEKKSNLTNLIFLFYFWWCDTPFDRDAFGLEAAIGHVQM